jgi:hypothetical protein
MGTYVRTLGCVRWDLLWADLTSQADAWERAELDGDVAERELIEAGAIVWMDRLRGSTGRPVTCRTRGGAVWRGQVHAHGADFVALASPGLDLPSHVVLRAGGIQAVVGLAGRAVPVEALGPVASRRTFASILRRAAVQRLGVAVHLDDGDVVAGDIGRVGRDYVDVADPASRVTSVVVDAIVALTPR